MNFLRVRKIFQVPLSFFKKRYSCINIGSAYILELEQTHARKASERPLTPVDCHNIRANRQNILVNRHPIRVDCHTI